MIKIKRKIVTNIIPNVVWNIVPNIVLNTVNINGTSKIKIKRRFLSFIPTTKTRPAQPLFNLYFQYDQIQLTTSISYIISFICFLQSIISVDIKRLSIPPKLNRYTKKTRCILRQLNWKFAERYSQSFDIYIECTTKDSKPTTISSGI